MKRHAVLVSFALLAAACGGQESLTAAAVPDVPGGMWAVSFQQPVDPLATGRHGYRLAVECSDGTAISPPVRIVEVGPQHELMPAPVYLRFDGPGTSFMAPYDLTGIHPDQEAVAVITLSGMDEDTALASVSACEGSVQVDGGEPIALSAGEPFIP